MARQKGHRANKANDSFGTINNDNLYRGKYREDVYQDDDEEQVQDPSQEVEATPEQHANFAEPQPESDTDYKKRYDDLKRHYDSKLNEWKKEKEELSAAQQAGRDSGLKASELPKTAEELEDFRAKYPDVYAIVETVSTIQAETKLNSLKDEIETLKKREKDLEIQSAYKQLVANHSDFPELRNDKDFISWLDEQPASIADGIYRNNTDAVWASRVVDLYKADKGIKKPRKISRDADPAIAVTRSSSRDVVGESGTEKKIWKASEIGKLKPWEFEKVESELDAARAEGRIDYRA